jgi:hypothetical protein
MSVPRRRKDYEMELSHLITEDLKCYVEHVGKTSGWDLIIAVPYKGRYLFVPVEVKTSVAPKINLNHHKRTKEQLKRYRGLKSRYGIDTVLAYRKISYAKDPVRKKWRFFTLRKATMTWVKGKTYEDFLLKLRGGKVGKNLRKKKRLQKDKRHR